LLLRCETLRLHGVADSVSDSRASPRFCVLAERCLQLYFIGFLFLSSTDLGRHRPLHRW
jgi:hypothetical protein